MIDLERSRALSVNRFNSVIRNSFSPFSTLDSGVHFIFRSYVYSQVAFPLMPRRPGRDFQEYANAYKILKGDFDYKNMEDFYKTLKYFYEDVSSTIKNTDLIECHDEFFYFTVNSNPVMRSLPTAVQTKILDTGRDCSWSWKDYVKELDFYSKANLENIVFLELR